MREGGTEREEQGGEVGGEGGEDGEDREQATAPCRFLGLGCDVQRTGGVLFKRIF